MIKDLVSFPDFQKLDIRVGRVLKAGEVTGSNNLIRMEVDLGKDYGVRQILAGLAKLYKPRQLKGKKFIFAANLMPKQMMGELSNGMILCADSDGGIITISVDKKIPEGTVVR